MKLWIFILFISVTSISTFANSVVQCELSANKVEDTLAPYLNYKNSEKKIKKIKMLLFANRKGAEPDQALNKKMQFVFNELSAAETENSPAKEFIVTVHPRVEMLSSVWNEFSARLRVLMVLEKNNKVLALEDYHSDNLKSISQLRENELGLKVRAKEVLFNNAIIQKLLNNETLKKIYITKGSKASLLAAIEMQVIQPNEILSFNVSCHMQEQGDHEYFKVEENICKGTANFKNNLLEMPHPLFKNKRPQKCDYLDKSDGLMGWYMKIQNRHNPDPVVTGLLNICEEWKKRYGHVQDNVDWNKVMGLNPQ